jgi:rubrerythrin
MTPEAGHVQDRAAIEAMVARDALAAVRALAAAERAVDEGRLNIAKLLRASALSARQRALMLERIASVDKGAVYTLAEIADENARTMKELADAEGASERTALAGATALDAIFDATIGSLREHRDVPEGVVAQFLFACEECGYVVQGQRPDVCPACGSFGGEFALFAPFFSGTQEHIGRRSPEQIVAMLRGDAAVMAASIAGLDDDALRRRPGDGEWCIKEIAGHMIDIVEMAARRLAPIADASVADAPETQLLPWRIVEGQDYPSKSADELLDRYGRGLETLLAIVKRLDTGNWRKKTTMSGSRVAAIDVGSWVANHNVAHLQQILALREAAT